MPERTKSPPEIPAAQVRGKSVIDNNGNDFGEVEDVTLNPSGWKVTGFVVNVKKEVADKLHLDRPTMGKAHVVIGADRVDRMGDNVVLNIGVAEMGGLITQDE